MTKEQSSLFARDFLRTKVNVEDLKDMKKIWKAHVDIFCNYTAYIFVNKCSRTFQKKLFLTIAPSKSEDSIIRTFMVRYSKIIRCEACFEQGMKTLYSPLCLETFNFP